MKQHRNTKDAHRLQIDLPAQSMERLKELKESMGVTSYANVVATSLAIAELIVKEREKGSTFLVKQQDEEVKELCLIF